MTKLLPTPVSVLVSRNRRKANKDLVHSPTSRLRMRADSPVCSPERPLCLLYHWPFHIPQPAWDVGPHWLQHCVLCLNLALSLAGLCVSDWDMWTCARCIFILYGMLTDFFHVCNTLWSQDKTKTADNEQITAGRADKLLSSTTRWNWKDSGRSVHHSRQCVLKLVGIFTLAVLSELLLSKQGWRNPIFLKQNLWNSCSAENTSDPNHRCFTEF